MENLENSEKNNKKFDKVQIIIVAVLLIIIICMGLYISYQKGILFSNSKVVEKEKYGVVKELNLSRCLNCDDGLKYSNPVDAIEDNGLSMRVNSDKKSVSLIIDWNKFGPLSSATAWSKEKETKKIDGFTKNVKDVFIGELGQDVKGLTLFYLMDDRTVEYTQVFKQNIDSYGNSYYSLNDKFVTNGALSGIKGVIKLYVVDVNNGSTGWKSTIALKKDGSYYDLGTVINNKNEEKYASENNDSIKELDLTKCLNLENGVSYNNAKDSSEDNGLSMEINPDKRSITLNIDWNKFGPLSSATAWSSETIKYQIKGFNKNIISTFVGELGQDSTGITLFYLMEDGTVEYTKMFTNKIDSKGNSYFEMNYSYDKSNDGRVIGEHFETSGQLEGVSSVIKLYTVNASNGSGWITTIGSLKDGSFYDLGNIINK